MEEQLLSPYGEEAEATAARPTPQSRNKGSEHRKKNFLMTAVVIGCVSVAAVVATLATLHSNNRPAADTSSGGMSTQAIGRPSFSTHPLLSGLSTNPTPVPGDDTVEHHSVHVDVVTTQHHTHFHQESDVVKDVHALNGNLAAIAINCTATEIEVTFNSSAAATDFAALLNPNSTFLPILEEWGCTGGAMVRKAGHYAVAHGNVATVATTNASLHDMFKNAHISFNGTRHPGMMQSISKLQEGAAVHTASATTEAPGRARRGFFHHLGHELHHLWTKVTAAIKSAATVLDKLKVDADVLIHLLATGQLEYSDVPWSTSFDQSNPCGNDAIGQGTLCTLAYDAELTFTITITNYHLQLLEIKMTGDAHTGVAATGAPITKDWDGSVTLPGFDTTLFNTIIMIGPIPIPLSLHGQMNNKFDWSVDGALNIDGNFDVAGDLAIGGRYTPAAGFVPIFTHDLNGDADINSATGSLTATGTITVTTQLLFQGFYAAAVSANIVVTPAITATGTETVEGAGVSFSEANSGHGFNVTHIPATSPSYGSACHPVETRAAGDAQVDIPSVQIGVSVGVAVTAAAKIDLKIAGHQIYDHSFPIGGDGYNHLFQIGDYCIHPHI